VPKTIDDARRLIESRLAEIEAEAKRLGRVLDNLGEEGSRRIGRRTGQPLKLATTPTSASPKSERPVAPKRKVGKRAARGQRRDDLLVAIKADPGARPSELAKSIGIRPAQVSVLIAKARAEKLIVRRGQGYELRG